MLLKSRLFVVITPGLPGIETVQGGRIYIELINGAFLEAGGTPDSTAPLLRAISTGWLWRHESGTYLKFTESVATAADFPMPNGIRLKGDDVIVRLHGFMRLSLPRAQANARIGLLKRRAIDRARAPLRAAEKQSPGHE
jgi:hypothetical protein